jgi:hypothetical protein
VPPGGAAASAVSAARATTAARGAPPLPSPFSLLPGTWLQTSSCGHFRCARAGGSSGTSHAHASAPSPLSPLPLPLPLLPPSPASRAGQGSHSHASMQRAPDGSRRSSSCRGRPPAASTDASSSPLAGLYLRPNPAAAAGVHDGSATGVASRRSGPAAAPLQQLPLASDSGPRSGSGAASRPPSSDSSTHVSRSSGGAPAAAASPPPGAAGAQTEGTNAAAASGAAHGARTTSAGAAAPPQRESSNSETPKAPAAVTHVSRPGSHEAPCSSAPPAGSASSSGGSWSGRRSVTPPLRTSMLQTWVTVWGLGFASKVRTLHQKSGPQAARAGWQETWKLGPGWH